VQNGSGTAVGVTLGAIWKASPSVRIGARYSRGPSFDFTVSEGPTGAPSPTVASGPFKVPDQFSVGAAVRVVEGLTVFGDVNRVTYSDLINDYIRLQVGTTPTVPGNPTVAQFTVSDGTEIHGGVEYLFTQVPRVPAIRAGVWYDPNHSVVYNSSTSVDPIIDERFRAYLPAANGVVHYAAGGGLSLSPRLEVNAAFDYSSRSRIASTSIIVRF
jgi:long-subunit fatty acid transport protein